MNTGVVVYLRGLCVPRCMYIVGFAWGESWDVTAFRKYRAAKKRRMGSRARKRVCVLYRGVDDGWYEGYPILYMALHHNSGEMREMNHRVGSIVCERVFIQRIWSKAESFLFAIRFSQQPRNEGVCSLAVYTQMGVEWLMTRSMCVASREGLCLWLCLYPFERLSVGFGPAEWKHFSHFDVALNMRQRCTTTTISGQPIAITHTHTRTFSGRYQRAYGMGERYIVRCWKGC